MKKRSLFLIPGIILVFTGTAFTSGLIQPNPDMPDEVIKIVSVSCYDCHTTGSKSKDALKALEFNKWNDLKPLKKVAVLSKIEEVMEKGVMPPGKYIKNFPDKALSDEDSKLIMDWAKEETDKLMK